MIYRIANKDLTVEISSKGAELQSIKEIDGTEYLWQGNPVYWSDRALNIFPYVARLTQGKYQLNGQEYQMNIHGFVCTAELAVEEKTEDRIVFALHADEDTRVQYPYEFVYRICYALEGKKLSITFSVENKDDKTMYFGIGGHPGFNVPLEAGAKFEDYYLEFSRGCKPVRIGFSEDCFVTGQNTPYQLEADRRLALHHGLFDDDAIVFQDMDKEITLKKADGGKSVTVTYPDMKYLGIWHMPKTDAPYVCIEPWSSLPSRKNVVEDLAVQPDLIHLEGHKTYENEWKISIL
ncbi:MAG: aldose 1-epimerase family protein [Lachnospiraceae bacterium]|nr:aldose 1-epimerase family protein [Lachnospiraceae bacterium]